MKEMPPQLQCHRKRTTPIGTTHHPATPHVRHHLHSKPNHQPTTDTPSAAGKRTTHPNHPLRLPPQNHSNTSLSLPSRHKTTTTTTSVPPQLCSTPPPHNHHKHHILTPHHHTKTNSHITRAHVLLLEESQILGTSCHLPLEGNVPLKFYYIRHILFMGVG